MGILRQSKFSGNNYWTGILYHDHEHVAPAPLVGPKFLWDARQTETITLEGDDSVTGWTDVYQGLLLTQSFGHDITKAPTYDTSGDFPTIHFNGVNNYLSQGSIGETSINFTYLVVAHGLAVNITDNVGWITYFTTGGANWDIEYVPSDINGIGIDQDGNNFGLFLANPRQVIAIRVSNDGTLGEAWINGGEGSSKNITILGGLDFLSLGSRVGISYLNGNIPWVAYYDTALSNDDLNAALTYAGSSFGFTVSPVVITPPA